MKHSLSSIVLCGALILAGCQAETEMPSSEKLADASKENQIKAFDIGGKPVVYQVFTRLFGNRNLNNKPWGTLEENGVGKFNDFTDTALSEIKALGTTHIWYTGVLHHAMAEDYTRYGISLDDPDVIKGRAGSPYAIKDYYNVNPDLAVDPANRLQEFKQLINRTHQQGMKVIIDIVPNHVARNYHSISMPKGVENLGAKDDTDVTYKKDNNFYYVTGEDFKVPESEEGYQPLGGKTHPLVDGKFIESPAKWTGNGSRKAQPDFYDWYETVKVNYGVRPDGSYDFTRLPTDFRKKDFGAHDAFWQDEVVPDSWKKMKEIVHYWLDLGVDGFRYDMAEMVPVEFWSYLNSSIKMKKPNAFLLAEVYNPTLYYDYIHLGKMDYLYDKVDQYDTLKLIMQGKQSTDSLLDKITRLHQIDEHLLQFLENHDEQRIASADFAGDPLKGRPAMVVTSLLGKGPVMVYFAQVLGESGIHDAGFGKATRTTIFDYWGLETLSRWANNGKYDGEQLTASEKSLRDFYQTLLQFVGEAKVLNGDYADLHNYNLKLASGYHENLFSFVRYDQNDLVIVIANFSDKESNVNDFLVSGNLVRKTGLSTIKTLKNLFDGNNYTVKIDEVGDARISLSVPAWHALVLRPQ